MFVMTMKWNKKRALLIILAAALILCLLILAIGRSGGDGSGSAPSKKVENSEDIVEFLAALGWQASSEPINQKEVIIPKEFSEIYEEYNGLQLTQGYDLKKFSGLEVTIYTYTITNYSGYSGDVVADIYVRDKRIVGGDIHSLALDGFMHGLKPQK